jgi:hypothetical protein
MNKPLTPLGIRLASEDMRAALAKAAEDDGRSMNSLIVKILGDWLKRKGYLK